MTEMTVIEISASGGPEVLALAKRPVPQAGPGQVLIEVVSAGVNGPDIMQRQGRYAPPPGASDLPGLEVARPVDRAYPSLPELGDDLVACDEPRLAARDGHGVPELLRLVGGEEVLPGQHLDERLVDAHGLDGAVRLVELLLRHVPAFEREPAAEGVLLLRHVFPRPSTWYVSAWREAVAGDTSSAGPVKATWTPGRPAGTIW